MFTINDDLSIYVTRGDVVFFSVTAEENGIPYKFRVDDILRIKITDKKDAESVLFQKTFLVEEETDRVHMHLTGDETRFGDVISKPTDYWYEVELNPFTNPQTIIGYDEDGAKIFRLFPEGDNFEYVEPEDIPLVDAELSLTSERPVQNQAVSRALIQYEERVAEAQERINTTADEAEQRVSDYVDDETDRAIERVYQSSNAAKESEEKAKEYAMNAEASANRAEAISGGDFFPKTGGTLENASVTTLILSNTASDSVMQGFKANGEIKGYIGFGNNGPVYKETSSSSAKRFLHEGNYKNFCDLEPIINGTTTVGNADKLDGKHASDFISIAGGTFVKDTGDVSITFQRKENNSQAYLLKGTHGLQITLRNVVGDGANERRFYIYDNSEQSDVGKALRLYDIVSGKGTMYDVLHTGNGLPLTGGTLTGNTTIKKAAPLIQEHDTASGCEGRFLTSDNAVTLQNVNVYGDTTNRRQLNLYNTSNGSFKNVADAIKLIDVVNGATKLYTVLHTGNTAKVVVSETPLTSTDSVRIW